MSRAPNKQPAPDHRHPPSLRLAACRRRAKPAEISPALPGRHRRISSRKSADRIRTRTVTWSGCVAALPAAGAPRVPPRSRVHFGRLPRPRTASRPPSGVRGVAVRRCGPVVRSTRRNTPRPPATALTGGYAWARVCCAAWARVCGGGRCRSALLPPAPGAGPRALRPRPAPAGQRRGVAVLRIRLGRAACGRGSELSVRRSCARAARARTPVGQGVPCGHARRPLRVAPDSESGGPGSANNGADSKVVEGRRLAVPPAVVLVWTRHWHPSLSGRPAAGRPGGSEATVRVRRPGRRRAPSQAGAAVS